MDPWIILEDPWNTAPVDMRRAVSCKAAMTSFTVISSELTSGGRGHFGKKVSHQHYTYTQFTTFGID